MIKISNNALDLLEKRYFQENESTWEDLCRRVAHNIASAETEQDTQIKAEEQYYHAMVDLDFLPSTPCLLNAGTKVQQLSSCFILDIEDSIDSIMQTLAECARIFQRSGGCGFNISALRPKGSVLNSSGGHASGPVSFMRLFNQLVEEVKHGNARKGAIKIDLDVSHPDIYEFIHCKDDTTQLQNMNISVSITDAFMAAVQKDGDWELHFNGKTHQIVQARHLWGEIIAGAWGTGEPGLSFRDTMNRHNMNPQLGEIKSSNPCLHKDTYMATENGLERISNLHSRIWNGSSYSPSVAWKTGNKQSVMLVTNSGFEYVVTPDHKIMLENGEWVEAQNTIGQKLKLDIREKEWVGIDHYPDTNYEILGFVLGGSGYHNASYRMKYIRMHANKDIYADALTEKLEGNTLPDWIMQLPKPKMREFLRGIFSVNETNLHKYHKVQLISLNKKMLQQVQQMLLLFGIKGQLWCRNKQNDVKFSTGTSTCLRPTHLVISKQFYIKFLDTIGFIQKHKNGYIDVDCQEGGGVEAEAVPTSQTAWQKTAEPTSQTVWQKTAEPTNQTVWQKTAEEEEFETVIMINDVGEQEVWDFTEPINHLGVTSGVYVHNCAEYINIPYSSCNLGSINLSNCVLADKSGTYILDYKKLDYLIGLGVQFIDNMITVNQLPLPKIQHVTEQMRPVGLGTMGLAELMFKLKLPMNTANGIQFIDDLYCHIRETAENASMYLAQEKTAYPMWAGSRWRIEGKKMRNSNILSIAPNGSIGFIAGVNGGIEPIFALAYTRRTQDGHQYYVVNDVFKETLKCEGLLSDNLLKKISDNRGSVKGLKEIPQWIQGVFVTAMDMTPMEHLQCLNAVSKHIDLSVSKTINLPNEATKEDVATIYLEAWKTGNIKGTTVYRDGSRQFQVLTTGAKKEVEAVPVGLQWGDTKDAPAVSHESRTVRLLTGCGTVYLTMTKDGDGGIDQTFVSRGSKGTCLSNQTAVSRLISLALRSGVSVAHVVDQLRSVPICPAYYGQRCKQVEVSPGASCPSAIAFELEKYAKINTPKQIIPDSNNISVHKPKCPTCNEIVRMEGGCVSCISCGWSECK